MIELEREPGVMTPVLVEPVVAALGVAAGFEANGFKLLRKPSARESPAAAHSVAAITARAANTLIAAGLRMQSTRIMVAVT